MPKPPKIENKHYSKIIFSILKNNNDQQKLLFDLNPFEKDKISQGELRNKLSYLHRHLNMVVVNSKRARGINTKYSVNFRGFIDYISLNILQIKKFENEMPFIEKCLKNFLIDEIRYNKLLESEQEPIIILSLQQVMETFISQIADFFDNMLHNAHFTHLYKKNLINDDEYNFTLNCYLYFAEKYKKKDSVRDSIIEIMPQEYLFN